MFFYKFAILLISDKFTKKGENNKSSEIQLQKEKGLYFEKLDSSMVIHREGTNTRVDFKNLDLSNLDKDYTMKMK